MEITEASLRAMVAEVDEQHRAGMATMPSDIAELHLGAGRREMASARTANRSTAALAGTALAIGALTVPLAGVLTPAYAAGDAGIAAFAESVELAAVAAYEAAASSGLVKTPAVLDAATTFAGHHKEHGAAFAAAAGSTATGKANPLLLTAVSDQLGAAKDEAGVLEIAYGLENAAAATYLFALGALTTPAALQLTASILPIEGQHAVVLGDVLGKPASDVFPPFQTQDGAVDPSKYPVS